MSGAEVANYCCSMRAKVPVASQLEELYREPALPQLEQPDCEPSTCTSRGVKALRFSGWLFPTRPADHL